MAAVINVEHISKKFRIGASAQSDTLVAQVRNFLRGGTARAETFYALNDVSFSVDEGEVFGIIGRNGSGKSTLLKILTGIMRPTRGEARIRGRIGALLEVGTGFHPDLSGRDNVYFNGALLGMNRADVNRKFDEIVAFAGVEKFIDTQVKHYSSGMQARLGFAVAAHLEPEVLIVDEVLSVGDLVFQERSVSRMNELRKSGITALFVSHNLNSVAALCSRSMLLEKGAVKAIGRTLDVLDAYTPKLAGGASVIEFDDDDSKPMAFTRAVLEREDGSPCVEFDIAEDIWLRLRYRVREPQPALQISIRVDLNREILFQTDDTDEHLMLGIHPAGLFEKRLKIRRLFLKEGDYSISILSGIPQQLFEEYTNALSFSVVAHTVNTQWKSYRRERPGKVICQGGWQAKELTEIDGV
jgi:lipopolysaccharide transport system ATP-binding protein